MKPTALLRAFLLGTTILATPCLQAARIYWDSNGVTSGVTDGLGAWLTANQWWDGSTNVSWTSGDDAVFGTGGAGGAVTLASPTTVGSLNFNYFTGTYTLGTASQTITLNSGITSNAGVGAVTIASPITLGAAQTWTNNSSGALTINSTGGGTNLNGFALTVGANRGTISFEGNASNVISGAGGITKNGSGSLLLDGATAITHTFTGGITVNGGRVGVQTGSNLTGRGNVTINDGYLGGRFGTTVTFAGGLGTGATQIRILGGTSGFSGEGSTGSTFTIGTAGSTLQWGTTNFNPAVLLLNGDQGVNTNGKGTLANAIDLDGATRTITSLQTTDGVATSGFTVSSAISTTSGTAGLTKTGIGNLILTATNTYNGATTISSGALNATSVGINGGSITLSGANGTINSTSALNLNGSGTLRLVNTAQVNRFADGAAITSNGGVISYENTAGANLNYTETLGSVTHSSGLLHIVLTGNQNNATNNSQTLTFGGLSQSGTASVTFSANTTGPQASGGDNMIVVSGAGTTTAGNIIGPWATTGTTAAIQTDYAVYDGNYVKPASIAASAESSWSTTHAIGSNYTLANASGSALSGRLTATRNVNSLRNTSTATALTSVDTALNTITVTGSSFTDGDVVTIGGTAPTGLTTGTPYYVVGASGSTFSLATTSGGSVIDITAAGAGNITGGITLSTGNNLGTYGILNASAAGMSIGRSGTGVVTLPTTTSGNLFLTAGQAGIQIDAPIADNGSGVLSLVKNGSGTVILRAANNTYTGDTVVNAGTLQIGASGFNAQLNSGAYAGNIFIGAGATLTLQGNSSNTLSGVISGDGNLNLSRGTTTLSGANTYTGKTFMSLVATNAVGSTVNVSSFNSVVGGTASSSLGAPTTVANGTIEFGGSVQVAATIAHTGAAETTDRVINFIFNSSGARVLDSSGSGLLKFTSAFTSNGTSTGAVTLQGSSNGEIVQGLPFAFTNLNKSGNGTWTLGGAVGSTGVITVNAGTLALKQRSSLQGGLDSNWTAAKINVKSGATLALNVDSTEAGGISATSLNTLLTNISVAGSASAGLQAGARIGLDTGTATGGTFTQGNAIANSTGANGGAIGLTKLGTGSLVLDKANTYTGSTIISAGILQLGAGGTTGSLSASSAITNNANLTINRSNAVAQGTDFSGAAITGTGSFTQAGGGTTTLSATNTYTGATTVSAGTLIVDGNISTSSLTTVQTGATLGGSGTVGDLTIDSGGFFSPGNSPGIMTVDGDYSQSGQLNVEIEGLTAGNGSGFHDQVVVNGTVSLGGALNLVSFTGFTPANGDLIFILLNDSVDTISGTFSGLAQGAVVGNYLGFNWEISYTGNSAGGTFTGGNDVVLMAVPEPRAALLGGLGMLLLLRRRR